MLEDDFCDILRKAKLGTGIGDQELARRTGLGVAEIDAWTRGRGTPGDEQARALAVVLQLDPAKLADSAAQRWRPDVALPFEVRHHPHDPHPSNGYLFFLEDGRTAALIDPAGIPATILNAIAEGPYALRYILVTHKHADHCDATADIAKAFPRAQIVMHKADVHAIGALARNALPVVDGDELPFGETAAIRMLHTPGHTDGSSCFLFKGSLFSGDTLFAGSIGGAYGDLSTYRDILESVSTKLFALDDETVVMPGHGPPTTIGLEKAHNPFF
ncbi:MAG: MBL fold metallo-hydrolase [Candidatus Baltobacteraceae bacterium]|jgi:glyoxylase-like metal-dependent hydrolase (beta-lactamase superfamily II)